MTQLEGMTTGALVAHLQAQTNLSDAEAVLLDRLVNALDEIDSLTRELAGTQRQLFQEVPVGQDP